jgi:DNA-binding FadR family transcriptional regulator
LCFYYNHAALAMSDEAKLKYSVPSHRQIYEAIKARKTREAEQLHGRSIRISAEWNKAIANVRRMEMA